MWNKSPVQVWCMIQGAQGWYTGMTQRDGVGREAEGGFRMGSTCTPMADSCQCMAKLLQYCKVISLQLKKLCIKMKRKTKYISHIGLSITFIEEQTQYILTPLFRVNTYIPQLLWEPSDSELAIDLTVRFFFIFDSWWVSCGRSWCVLSIWHQNNWFYKYGINQACLNSSAWEKTPKKLGFLY